MKLLFGAQIVGAGVVMTRIAGISLIALGLACWPDRIAARELLGILTYSTLATVYLVYLGLGGEWSGILLWPAVAAHQNSALHLAKQLRLRG